jgi:hypothetical protein
MGGRPNRLSYRNASPDAVKRFLIVALLGLMLTACGNDAFAPLPKPPKVSVVPTATTLADFSDVSIPAVQGTTTTLAVGFKGGNANINGRVTLGGTPIPGANVHIERFDGDNASGVADVTADASGNFGLSGVHGGRFRIRAYRPPDATMGAAQIFFLGANETKTMDLQMQSFTGSTTVSASVSPDPPISGSISTLVVSVSTRGVDPSGVARSIPLPGVPVTVITGGGRSIVTPNPGTTASNGRALFSFQCNSLDRQGVSVLIPGGAVTPVNVAACELPPTTTTTAVDPAGTTTTTGLLHKNGTTTSTPTTIKAR